jgi:transcriptional regulator with XRE-family HTH domain
MSPGKVKQLLAQRVRQLRLEQGLTAAAFARIIGKSPSWLSDFEHGKFNSTVETLHLMAEALGHDECDFFVFPDRNVRHEVLDLTRQVSEDDLHDAKTYLIRAREARKKTIEERQRRLGSKR